MRRRKLWAFAALAAALPLAAAGQAQDDIVSVPEDLLAVLTLRGKPCDRVVEHRRQAESDYLVTCADGHRYRVYIANKRVVVEDR